MRSCCYAAGGGAAADMAAFNSIEVVGAIVAAPVPVVTGIVHAHDTTAADLVAHTTTPTPTAAASWVLASNRHSQDQAIQAALVAQQRQASSMPAKLNTISPRSRGQAWMHRLIVSEVARICS